MRKGYHALNEHFMGAKIAHRGLHSDTVSENSLQAFRLAIEKGFAIEIDVHLLRDGEVAVVHDSDLARVTGQSVIVETLSSEELQNYPLKLNGEKIPTLRETLALIDGKVPLLIELKFGKKFDKNQADAVLAQLAEYPYKDMIALQSFHPSAVRYLKKKSNDYSVGFLSTFHRNLDKFTTYILKSLVLFDWMKADFVSYAITDVPNKYVTKKQKQGYPLLVWTINTPERLEQALKIADGIIFEKIEV
jgi:glycerophosphoryl diester phosphodiesterase